MAHITELGPAYFQKLYWHTENPPLLHLDTTQETDRPYRTGRCLVVRLPFTRTALVLGVWTGRRKEFEALISAVGGRVIAGNSISADDYNRQGELN